MLPDVSSCLSLSTCSKRFRSIIMPEISRLIVYHYTDRTIKIPSWVIHLYLEQSIKCRQIPPSVKSIQFATGFNDESLEWIPPSVTSLIFCNDFRQFLSAIPPTVRNLRIDKLSYMDGLLDQILPSHIRHLIISVYTHESSNNGFYYTYHGLVRCKLREFRDRNTHCIIIAKYSTSGCRLCSTFIQKMANLCFQCNINTAKYKLEHYNVRVCSEKCANQFIG